MRTPASRFVICILLITTSASADFVGQRRERSRSGSVARGVGNVFLSLCNGPVRSGIIEAHADGRRSFQRAC